MRHIMAAVVLAGALALTAACGSDDASEATPAGTVIEVTLHDGQVSPAGDRVQAAEGEPITIRIDADVAGELHVHSVPEGEIAFDAGTSEHEITIDQPGVVEVELHEPPLVVVQIEVR